MRTLTRTLIVVLVAPLLALFTNGKATADDVADEHLHITVTLTVSGSLKMQWCNNDGSGGVETAQAWALNGVQFARTYDTDEDNDAEGLANTLGGVGASGPGKPYFLNAASGVAIDIDAICSNSADWTAADAAAANAFLMRGGIHADPGPVSYSTYKPSPAVYGVVANLANNAWTTEPILLKLTTPNAGSTAGSETITVTFTASVHV